MNKEKKTLKLRPYAASICDLFENLLADHGILIPDEDREGEEGEACIYGCTYYDLEKSVAHVLSVLIDEVKKDPAVDVDADNY